MRDPLGQLLDAMRSGEAGLPLAVAEASGKLQRAWRRSRTPVRMVEILWMAETRYAADAAVEIAHAFVGPERHGSHGVLRAAVDAMLALRSEDGTVEEVARLTNKVRRFLRGSVTSTYTSCAIVTMAGGAAVCAYDAAAREVSGLEHALAKNYACNAASLAVESGLRAPGGSMDARDVARIVRRRFPNIPTLESMINT